MRAIFCALLLSVLSVAPVVGKTQTVEGLPQHEVVPVPAPEPGARVRNVILMIGDGMGQEHVWAAWLCNGGKLNITGMPYTAFSCTVAANRTITDSAAGGTALACGCKTNNGMLGQTPNGRPAESLAALFRKRGMATGLVVTKAVTDATPAAFYAHTRSRKNTAEIAEALASAGFDVVLGGGAAAFSAQQMERMRAKGADVELFAPGDCAPASQRGDLLVRNVKRALSRLESEKNGFFLMIEGSRIDLAAHDNDLTETMREVLDFDRALGEVLRWLKAHPDTLVVVVADHQTGGLAILDGDRKRGRVTALFTTGGHSGVSVPVYAAGAGASAIHGVLDNTQLQHEILRVATQK